jgi:hypothetical protein
MSCLSRWSARPTASSDVNESTPANVYAVRAAAQSAPGTKGEAMIRRLLVVVAVGSAVAACSSPTGTTTVLPSAAGTTSAASTASKSSTPVSTQASRRGTAEQDLAPFLAEVRQADARLRHAAALINAGIGAAVVLVDQVTATAVRAAQPDTAAARAVPRGLAPELLRRTLVVYHDLVARHAAMGYFLAPGSHPRGSGSGVSSAAGLMLECLANGAAPASRFAADLASLEQYARTQPAITAAQEDVVAEAEVAVRVRLIVARNRCADECGSAVFTNLAKVTWTVRPTASAAGQGEVEGVTFTVTPSARGWAVKLNAC